MNAATAESSDCDIGRLSKWRWMLIRTRSSPAPNKSSTTIGQVFGRRAEPQAELLRHGGKKAAGGLHFSGSTGRPKIHFKNIATGYPAVTVKRYAKLAWGYA
jgi:hypothetical protein